MHNLTRILIICKKGSTK